MILKVDYFVFRYYPCKVMMNILVWYLNKIKTQLNFAFENKVKNC